MRWPPPLRYSVPAILLLLGGLVVAVSVTQSVRLAMAREEREALANVSALASMVAGRVEDDLRLGNSSRAYLAMQDLSQDRRLDLAMLVDDKDTVRLANDFNLNGRHVASTPLAPNLAAIEDARRTRLKVVLTERDRRSVLALMPVVLGFDAGDVSPRKFGVLAIRQDLVARQQEALRDALVNSARSGVLLLALTLLAWLALRQIFTNRIKRLVAGADRLAAGEFGARTGLGGDDELATLSQRLDAMADALESNTETLRESERRFRRLIEFGSDVVLTLDRYGRVVYAGPTTQRLTGWTPDQLRGRVLVSLLHADDRAAWDLAMVPVLREPGFTQPWQARLRTADGTWRPFELIGHNPGEGAGDEQVVVNARDVAQRARLEEELRQSQKMDAIGRLAGGVAHDFNNLLTVILGSAEMLRDLAPDEESAVEIAQIFDAARRASELTKQLLTFSRRQRPRLEVVDVAQIVREMDGLVRRLIGAHIDVVLDLPTAPADVLADRSQIGQVMLNLAANARDAMPQGGTLRIAVTSEGAAAGDGAGPGAGEAQVVVRVSDNGVGMSALTRARLFEPFFTTKAPGSGTGLGLSSVYGILTQLGGHIDVESAPGKGTVFTLRIPAVTPDTGLSLTHRASEVQRGNGESVLVIEDDAAVRALTVRLVERLGYRVRAAQHGREGLDLLAAERADIVLCDIIMPVMGGLQFVDEARRAFPGVPVLLVTGHAGDTAKLAEALAAGVPLLEKPFTESGLAAALRAALTRVP